MFMSHMEGHNGNLLKEMKDWHKNIRLLKQRERQANMQARILEEKKRLLWRLFEVYALSENKTSDMVFGRNEWPIFAKNQRRELEREITLALNKYYKNVIAAVKTEAELRQVIESVRYIAGMSYDGDWKSFLEELWEWKHINVLNINAAMKTIEKYVKLRKSHHSNIGIRTALKRGGFDPQNPNVVRSARTSAAKAWNSVNLEQRYRHMLNGLRAHSVNPTNARALSPVEARDMIDNMIRAERLHSNAGMPTRPGKRKRGM
jgi:hypothetical protein